MCFPRVRLVWRPHYKSLFAMLAYSGLANIWRFPYICHKHGGFVFLVPYILVLILIVLPQLLLRLAPAQYCSRSTVVLFKNLAPLAVGLGWASLAVAALVAIYYALLLGWMVNYVVAAVRGQPWKCNNFFNTPDCVPPVKFMKNITVKNTSCDGTNYSSIHEFFYLDVLHQSSTPWEESSSSIHLNVLLGLCVSWCVTFLLLTNIYSTVRLLLGIVLLPLALLFVFLVYAMLSYPISGSGPVEWSNAVSPEAWLDAVTHVLFSYGFTQAGLASIASHNTLLANFYRDVVILIVFNTVTCVVSYAVVRSTLQCVAGESGENGFVLVFIAYPLAVAGVGMSRIWAVLFFLILFFIGVSSHVFVVLNITINLEDRWPALQSFRLTVLCGVCFTLLLLGLPLCTPAGPDLLELLEKATTGPVAVLICLLGAVLLAFCCGFDRLQSIMIDTLQLRISRKSQCFLKFTWQCLNPIAFIVALIGSGYYAWSKSYPVYSHLCGWSLALVEVAIVAVVVGGALYKIATRSGPLSELLIPTEQFVPECESVERAYDVAVAHRLSISGSISDVMAVFENREANADSSNDSNDRINGNGITGGCVNEGTSNDIDHGNGGISNLGIVGDIDINRSGCFRETSDPGDKGNDVEEGRVLSESRAPRDEGNDVEERRVFPATRAPGDEGNDVEEGRVFPATRDDSAFSNVAIVTLEFSANDEIIRKVWHPNDDSCLNNEDSGNRTNPTFELSDVRSNGGEHVCAVESHSVEVCMQHLRTKNDQIETTSL